MDRLKLALAIAVFGFVSVACASDGVTPSENSSPGATPPPATGAATPGY